MTGTRDVTLHLRGEHGQGIPADVLSTVLSALAQVYPHGGVSTTGTGFMLRIPEDDRGLGGPPAVDTDAAFTPAEDDEDMEVRFTGPGSALAPETLSQNLAFIGAAALAAHDAVNYLEINAHHPEVGDFHVIIARTEGQSPRALHQAAEQALAGTVAKVTEFAATLPRGTGQALLALLPDTSTTVEDEHQ